MNRMLGTLPILALLASCSGGPQEVVEWKKEERTITVTGSAEYEAEPDLATVSINFREYYEEEFQNVDRDEYKTLVEIDKVKESVMSDLKEFGVPMDSIRLRNNGVYQRWYFQRPLKQRTITFKSDDLEMVEKLLDGMDVHGVDAAYVSNKEFSKQDQKRRELKIQALKEARKKAGYLLEAEGKKVGDAVTIREMGGDGDLWYPSRDRLSNARYSEAEITTKYEPIKMRYEVSATFSIE